MGINLMKNQKYHSVRTVSKYNRMIVETDTTNKHVHDCSFLDLIETSRDRAETSHLSEMIRSCIFHMCVKYQPPHATGRSALVHIERGNLICKLLGQCGIFCLLTILMIYFIFVTYKCRKISSLKIVSMTLSVI